ELLREAAGMDKRRTACAHGRRLTASVLRARGRALECFCKLCELVLVGERELDSTAADLRVKARQLLERGSHPCDEPRIDGRRTKPRLLPCAGPLRTLLCRTHRKPLLHDLPCKPAPALVIRDREHRARVSFGELPALEHREHVVRQLEQAN